MQVMYLKKKKERKKKERKKEIENLRVTQNKYSITVNFEELFGHGT